MSKAGLLNSRDQRDDDAATTPDPASAAEVDVVSIASVESSSSWEMMISLNAALPLPVSGCLQMGHARWVVVHATTLTKKRKNSKKKNKKINK